MCILYLYIEANSHRTDRINCLLISEVYVKVKEKYFKTKYMPADILLNFKRYDLFQNMVLRRIFGPRRDEVTGEWRRLHNEELSDLYFSPNIVRLIKSRRMRWVGHVACMGEERGVYRVLVGKPEGKILLWRPRHRWVDNIRMDLQEVGCGYMDWIGRAQDRDRWLMLVSAVMNFRVL